MLSHFYNLIILTFGINFGNFQYLVKSICTDTLDFAEVHLVPAKLTINIIKG